MSMTSTGVTMTPQTVAAHNVLSEERLTKSVTFPLTGDYELDLAAGILAVINSSDHHAAAVHRVLTLITARWAENMKKEQDNYEDARELIRRQLAFPGMGIAGNPPSPFIPSYSPVVPSSTPQAPAVPWYTSCQNKPDLNITALQQMVRDNEEAIRRKDAYKQ